jgi:hypothetical protein
MVILTAIIKSEDKKEDNLGNEIVKPKEKEPKD